MMIAPLYLAAASALQCRVVTDDVIRMRDLAAVAPVFSSLDGDSVIAYAPLPGAIRMMPEAQLLRLAARYGVERPDFLSVCFQRPMRTLAGVELLDTARRALSMPGAEIELIDYSRTPAPEGDVVFPRAGLALSPAHQTTLWKGYIEYGSGHHFPIWIRVKIRARLNRVIAIDNLLPGRAVREDQLRIEPLDGVPDALAPAQSLDQVVGKNLLRPVRRGATVSLDDLSMATVIRRGDKVDVDFESPALHLRFEASAEMDGRLGDRIRLRNLQTNKVFAAEVSGKDQARVFLGEEASRPGAPLRPAGAVCGDSGEEEKGCP